jgi:hypothetical protein
MKLLVPTIILYLAVISCSSSKLVNDWKSPDTPVFEANKVLVIGLAQDRELRIQFEEELTSRLEKNGVAAVRSIDFFEYSFSDERKTEEELNAIENQLLEAGFDAILFSKVIGSEEKVTTTQRVRDFSDAFLGFKEDYFESQDIYRIQNTYETYKLFHAETNLYCICPDKERELLWSGNIDIVENQNRKRGVKDYVKTLISTLEEKQLLIVQ